MPPNPLDSTAIKKIKGHKRHIITDTLGLILGIKVHAANIHDTKSGYDVAKLAFSQFPNVKKIFADAGYRKTFVNQVSKELGVNVEIAEKITDKKWKIVPKRWIVERTFAWFNNSRILSKDYTKTIISSEATVTIAAIRAMLKRL